MRVKDARQTFVGIWIYQLLKGIPIEVWDGQQLRDFTYVEDAIDAFLLAALSESANGQVFNLGGDGVISLKDLAVLLVQINGGGVIPAPLVSAAPKPVDVLAFLQWFST